MFVCSVKIAVLSYSAGESVDPHPLSHLPTTPGFGAGYGTAQLRRNDDSRPSYSVQLWSLFPDLSW